MAKLNLFLHVVGRRPDGYHLANRLPVHRPGRSPLVFAAFRRSHRARNADSRRAAETDLTVRAAQILRNEPVPSPVCRFDSTSTFPGGGLGEEVPMRPPSSSRSIISGSWAFRGRSCNPWPYPWAPMSRCSSRGATPRPGVGEAISLTRSATRLVRGGRTRGSGTDRSDILGARTASGRPPCPGRTGAQARAAMISSRSPAGAFRPSPRPQGFAGRGPAGADDRIRACVFASSTRQPLTGRLPLAARFPRLGGGRPGPTSPRGLRGLTPIRPLARAHHERLDHLAGNGACPRPFRPLRFSPPIGDFRGATKPPRQSGVKIWWISARSITWTAPRWACSCCSARVRRRQQDGSTPAPGDRPRKVLESRISPRYSALS